MLGFTLNEEQDAFRVAVRDWAARALAPRVEELEATETFPVDLFRELGRLGYLGVGIPEAEQGRLFERFFRASTSAVARGTGLGLSIVKSIVEVHGGTIAVRSAEGAGTTFSIDLPAQLPTEVQVGAGSSQEVAK